jgi:hypothetical protein
MLALATLVGTFYSTLALYGFSNKLTKKEVNVTYALTT